MPKRVLIVEDNPFSLELTSELIRAKGHQVICATSGTEALSIARAEQPDLILLDVRLPGVDGLTLSRALKAEPATERIPIVGISPDDLQRLFQEFEQLEPSYTKRHQGSGLGLALCKRLVELHGGKIWASSEGEGRGSTFTFTIPAAGPADRPRDA